MQNKLLVAAATKTGFSTFTDLLESGEVSEPYFFGTIYTGWRDATLGIV